MAILERHFPSASIKIKTIDQECKVPLYFYNNTEEAEEYLSPYLRNPPQLGLHK